MNPEEKIELRYSIIEDICDFFSDEDPDGYEDVMDAAGSAFDRRFTGASKKRSEELREASKEIYAAILKGGKGISAADRFFVDNESAFDEDELEAVNSIRRAIWSFFLVQSVKGPDQYELIDTNNSAVYRVRTIDELELETGSILFSSIIPDDGQFWQFFGGISSYGGDNAEKQVELAKKRKEMSDLYDSEFREYFKSRIANFQSASECEKAMTGFIRWQNGMREKENPDLDSNAPRLNEFHLPEGMDGPVAMISTSAGIAFSWLFAKFLDFTSGKFPKEKTRKMFLELLVRQDLFDDPMLEAIWHDYKSDLLRLACDSFPDVTDEESFVKKLLHYRPAIFDPKHLTLALVENGEPVDDLWSPASSMFFSHRGTGHQSITDANREDFLPLLVTVEATITQFYRRHRETKDKEVLASLKEIRDNPDHRSGDALAGEILDELRKLLIKTRIYDKRDVSLAASYILNSVKRHHSSGGSRGYLEFIDGMLGDFGMTKYK